MLCIQSVLKRSMYLRRLKPHSLSHPGLLYAAAVQGVSVPKLYAGRAMLSISEHSLRAMVMDAHVRGGLWVRNGLSVQDMVCGGDVWVCSVA